MNIIEPIPKLGETYLFFANDQIKEETKYTAKVNKIYDQQQACSKLLYKYDDSLEEVIAYPLMDIWLEEASDLFWILSPDTDYIIELAIPDLCPQPVYIARTIDGGWHSFETISPKEFGFLDVIKKY